MTFQGFSPETMDFLWGIRFNNDRTWFAEHKEQYQRTLLAPMKALAAELAPSFADVPELSLHVSRIYRDMRLHPATFYKDSLWFQFQCKRRGSVLENPCLCFELRPEGYRYGFLLYCARAAQMEELRKKMLENPERFLALVTRAERESGLTLEGDPYARPKPCADVRLSRFFGYKNFFALRDCPPDELLFSPELKDEVRRVFLAWQPMEAFCRV